MLEFNYKDEKEKYEIEVKSIDNNRIKIIGKIPVRGKGFILSRKGYNDQWDYLEYKTVYKIEENAVIFSKDGSVYTEPEKKVITEEEQKEIEKANRIQSINAAILNKKAELEKTDYIYIKRYEAELGNENYDEYDYAELHKKRKELREDINILEKELEEINK